MKAKTILKGILSIDLYIAIATAIVLIGVTSAGVFFRYVLNHPLVWGEEAQLACIVWILFYGASAAVRTKGHATVDIVLEQLGTTAGKIFNVFIYIIVMIVLGYLLVNGYKMFIQMIDMHRLTDALRIPYAIVYSAMPVSCLLMMINYTGMLFAPQFFADIDEEEII